MLLWLVDYFELKAISKQQVQEGHVEVGHKTPCGDALPVLEGWKAAFEGDRD